MAETTQVEAVFRYWALHRALMGIASGDIAMGLLMTRYALAIQTCASFQRFIKHGISCSLRQGSEPWWQR
jgi:hypothetical protein